jgi:hypothetical protein
MRHGEGTGVPYNVFETGDLHGLLREKGLRGASVAMPLMEHLRPRQSNSAQARVL